MTDTRSERHPGERTMLGARQLAWLIAELERAARDPVALLVWVNTVPWIAADGDGNGWGQFAAERSLIGERIAALGLGPRMAMMSGDAHMLAFDDGRNNAHGGFVVAQAAPLDRFNSTKGGPYSHDAGGAAQRPVRRAARHRRRHDADRALRGPSLHRREPVLARPGHRRHDALHRRGLQRRHVARSSEPARQQRSRKAALQSRRRARS